MKFVKLLAPSIILTVLPFAMASATAADTPPKTAICNYVPANGEKGTTVVFYLTAYDADGTAYYRTFSAQTIEITRLPDGSIGTTSHPCTGEIEFQN
ncbi:hypothetical protein [Roseibium sp.]